MNEGIQISRVRDKNQSRKGITDLCYRLVSDIAVYQAIQARHQMHETHENMDFHENTDGENDTEVIESLFTPHTPGRTQTGRFLLQVIGHRSQVAGHRSHQNQKAISNTGDTRVTRDSQEVP